MNDLEPTPHHELAEILHHHVYYQLVNTLFDLLPAPVNASPEALLARNEAAMAKVYDLRPVNADEADLAGHVVITRSQAEATVREIRDHPGDTQHITKLRAQHGMLERTANATRALLLRVQTARHKRDADGATATVDEWATYIARQRMRKVADQAAAAAGRPSFETAAPDQPAVASPAAEAGPALPALHLVVPAPVAAASAQPVQPPQTEIARAAPHPAATALSQPPAAQAPAAQALAAQALAAQAPAAQALAAQALAAQAPAAQAPAAARPRSTPARTAAQAPSPRRSYRLSDEIDWPERNLVAEADQYAATYPYRARPMRKHGGLPPDCTYGPPDDDLIQAIVTGTTPLLLALDDPANATL